MIRFIFKAKKAKSAVRLAANQNKNHKTFKGLALYFGKKNPPQEEDGLKGVWALAITTLFGSMATVMVCSVLPLFLCETLRASKTSLGLIEGAAVFIAFATKCLAGVLSDFFKTRKYLIVLGAVMAVLAKSMFAIAGNIFIATSARFIDRCGKGFRAAPVDALVADLTNNKNRGNGYGIRYSMAAVGMVLGYIAASAILKSNPGQYSLVFTMSIVPSGVALFLSIFVVMDAKPNKTLTNQSIVTEKKEQKVKITDKIKALPKNFWMLMLVIFVLMLARFSEGFLTLYAKEFNWKISDLPLLMIIYELANAATSIAVGKIADRFNNYYLLLFGVLILALKNAATILNTSDTFVLIMFAAAGIHMGIYQAVIAKLLSQKAGQDLRGTVFSIYYLIAGVAVLLANYTAGYLADNFGLAGTFYGGLIFSGSAVIVLAFFVRRLSMQNKATKT